MHFLRQRGRALLLGGGFFTAIALFTNWVGSRFDGRGMDPQALGQRPAVLAVAGFLLGALAVLIAPQDNAPKRFWHTAQPYFFFIVMIYLPEFRPERWQHDLAKLLFTATVTAALMTGLLHFAARLLGIGRPPGPDA